MDEFGGNLFFYPHPVGMICQLFNKRTCATVQFAALCGLGYFGYKFAKHDLFKRIDGMIACYKSTMGLPMPLCSSKETDMKTMNHTIRTLGTLRFTICIVHEHVCDFDHDLRKLLVIVDISTIFVLYGLWPPSSNGIKEYKSSVGDLGIDQTEQDTVNLIQENVREVTKIIPQHDDLCIVAKDKDTLHAITEEVREVINQSYLITPHRVTNRRDIADLPSYRRAICCVQNNDRFISFDEHDEVELDADLGFRAFDKMERSTHPRGVIIILFNHANSKGSSELYNMEGIRVPRRLQKLANDKRFLSVYRQFNKKQQEQIKEWIKP